jgi:iron complex outermembrane receptor protein
MTRINIQDLNPKLVIQILAALLLTTSVAVAQEQEEVIEEILVSIQKRSEPIQEVPIAITALSGEIIGDVNLDDYKDLVAFTPGLTGNSKDSFTDVLQIRGIYTTDYGVGGDPSISFFKNGLYQGRSGAMVTSLYDIDRAEVARGSQGFLVGRNSIAGTINVFTTRPEFDQLDAYIDVDAGQRGHNTIEAASNFTILPNLAARLAVYSSEEDGYVDDAFNPANNDLLGHEKKAARLSLLSEFDDTEINFTAEYEDRKQAGTIYRAIPNGETWDYLEELFDVSLGGGNQDVYSDFSLGNGDDSRIWSLGLQIDHDLGWATLTSLTGYKEHDWFYAEDYDGTALRIASYSQAQSGDYFDQEFRLVSNSEGPLT